MAIEEFFDHRCDIYHLQSNTTKRGYGLPDASQFGYPAIPDIADQACHFSVKSGTLVVVQNEPQRDINASFKLTLPADTDIRVNDKIVDCDTGIVYEAELPRNIRGHHRTVLIHKANPTSL